MFWSLALAWTEFTTELVIRKRGFRVICVGDYQHDVPSWAYTIGFDERFNHPELIVFDLPPQTAANVFLDIYDDLQRGEYVIEDGAQVAGIENHCVWKKARAEQMAEWLPLACQRRYRKTGKRSGLEAFQFVLSDADGRVPWEPGYDERLRPLPAGALGGVLAGLTGTTALDRRRATCAPTNRRERLQPRLRVRPEARRLSGPSP